MHQVDAAPAAWAKETPTRRGTKCPGKLFSCTPTGRSTRSNPAPWSTSPGSQRNAWRDGRPCLQRKTQISNIWPRATKLVMTRRITFLPMVMRKKREKKKRSYCSPKTTICCLLVLLSTLSKDQNSAPRPACWRCCKGTG